MRKLTPKICSVCNKAYMARLSHQSACSRKCYDVRYRKSTLFGTCKHCGKDFTTTKQSKKFCSRDCKQKSFKKEQPAKNREWRLTRQYGLDLAKYSDLLLRQSGLCSICKEPPPEGKALNVDHDHETGEVRSLLCGSCNRGLGLFKDSPEVLLAAHEYLKKHKEK
jgi:hypothetical protein